MLAAALRLHWIGFGSLDIDEAFTVWVAQHPLRDLWGLLGRLDDHPPLYYLALHAWIALVGDGAVAVRTLSVACGVLTVGSAYALGRIVGGRRLGVLTALLVACAPDLVQWSQEARMYALETLALAIAMVALARALAGDRPPGSVWAAYAVGTAAAVWTEYTAVLFPVAVIAVLVGAWPAVPPSARRQFVADWLRAHAAVALLCVPLLWLVVHQIARGTVVTWYALNPTAPLATLVVGIGLVLLGRAIWRAHPQWTALTVGLWVVPIACLIVISLRAPIFIKRAYLWTDVPLFLAVAAGLLAIPRPAARSALIGAVAVVNLLGVSAHYHNDLAADVLRRWDQAAAYVDARARPGDLILIYVPYVQPAFDYYFGPAHPGVEERAIPADIVSSGVLFPPLAAGDAATVRALASGHPRVWFVHGMYPSAQVILSALAERGRLTDSRTVTEALHIYLYQMGQADVPARVLRAHARGDGGGRVLPRFDPNTRTPGTLRGVDQPVCMGVGDGAASWHPGRGVHRTDSRAEPPPR
ncbi:MAG TPA: glycosyltransferase family 39 protein [bacterium]|nr:glycosyltransferase family 39 protein [bacterium]